VLDDLIVLHLEGGSGAPATPLHGLQWQTCLRRIQFLRDGEIHLPSIAAKTKSEVYRGERAYQFLLEVVCGLNSPLVGETAVMGQFRDFCGQAKLPASSWGWFLRQFMSDILVDAKRVRHEHLQGLGSQSYGGLVRQHLAGISTTAVVGSGQLAEEILPWLIGKIHVHLFYRNRLRAETLLSSHPQIRIDKFESNASVWNDESTALIVAAPIASEVIEDWMKQQRVRFAKILDLRGEAATDRLRSPEPVIQLSEMFARLKSDRQRLGERAAIARAEIKKLTESRIKQAQYRPFGWEDLCA
jgi:glutamyl-tRNA reductase